MELQEKERIEIEFWKNSPSENPSVFTVENFINKNRQAEILLKKINNHQLRNRKPKSVLELGAGQGWASCLMKRFIFPTASFTVTDISPYAIESIAYWEKIYQIDIENKLACRSYELPFAEQSFDLIFCYAAAHHFVELEKTLLEIKRVLNTNGQCIFFYEPTCSKLFYPLHFKYVNGQRPEVPEDVIIPSAVDKISKAIGLNYVNHYDHTSQSSASLAMKIYFSLLNTIPFIKRLLPSSSDLSFRHQ